MRRTENLEIPRFRSPQKFRLGFAQFSLDLALHDFHRGSTAVRGAYASYRVQVTRRFGGFPSQRSLHRPPSSDVPDQATTEARGGPLLCMSLVTTARRRRLPWERRNRLNIFRSCPLQSAVTSWCGMFHPYSPLSLLPHIIVQSCIIDSFVPPVAIPSNYMSFLFILLYRIVYSLVFFSSVRADATGISRFGA